MTKVIVLVTASKSGQMQKIRKWVRSIPPTRIVKEISGDGNYVARLVKAAIDWGEADTVAMAEFPGEYHNWFADLQDFCKAHGIALVEAGESQE